MLPPPCGLAFSARPATSGLVVGLFGPAGGWCRLTEPSPLAHWCTVGVSVILNGSLMHHHRCVGDLGWVVDAPEVPSSHRPLLLDTWMSTLSSAGLGGSRGVVTVDRAERR